MLEASIDVVSILGAWGTSVWTRGEGLDFGRYVHGERAVKYDEAWGGGEVRCVMSLLVASGPA
jgi:hypothetical protein